MEFMPQGSLTDFMRKTPKLPEPSVFSIFLQVLKGLLFLDSQAVIHRDLKPDNILIRDSDNGLTVKIADFSIAERLDNTGKTLLHRVCGTPGFMAPEVYAGAYDRKADVYSLGLVLFYL